MTETTHTPLLSSPNNGEVGRDLTSIQDMDKVKLEIRAVSEIVGNEEICIVIVVDEAHTSQIAIICDAVMKEEIKLRIKKKKVCNTMLPEVLTNVLMHQFGMNFEIIINDIVDGTYRAMIVDTDTYQPYSLRASDAILLHLISNRPLYATKQLMKRQAVPFVKGNGSMPMPYNALSENLLREALQNAVENEAYEAASVIRDELKKRGLDPSN